MGFARTTLEETSTIMCQSTDAFRSACDWTKSKDKRSKKTLPYVVVSPIDLSDAPLFFNKVDEFCTEDGFSWQRRKDNVWCRKSATSSVICRQSTRMDIHKHIHGSLFQIEPNEVVSLPRLFMQTLRLN